jgi:hypothetical protein
MRIRTDLFFASKVEFNLFWIGDSGFSCGGDTLRKIFGLSATGCGESAHWEMVSSKGAMAQFTLGVCKGCLNKAAPQAETRYWAADIISAVWHPNHRDVACEEPGCEETISYNSKAHGNVCALHGCKYIHGYLKEMYIEKDFLETEKELKLIWAMFPESRPQYIEVKSDRDVRDYMLVHEGGMEETIMVAAKRLLSNPDDLAHHFPPYRELRELGRTCLLPLHHPRVVYLQRQCAPVLAAIQSGDFKSLAGFIHEPPVEVEFSTFAAFNPADVMEMK